MSGWYTWQGNDLILTITLQPRASKDEVIGVHGETLKIRVTAPPVDGKANAHLCAFVARICEVSKSAVSLIAGASSRQKRLRVRLQNTILPKALARFG